MLSCKYADGRHYRPAIWNSDLFDEDIEAGILVPNHLSKSLGFLFLESTCVELGFDKFQSVVLSVNIPGVPILIHHLNSVLQLSEDFIPVIPIILVLPKIHRKGVFEIFSQNFQTSSTYTKSMLDSHFSDPKVKIDFI